MGVYIKGMDMPKSCGDCPCGSVYFGYKCMAEQKKFEKYPLDSRQDWCPLVHVPSHGRLIDKNSVFELIRSMPSVDKLLPVEFMKALYEIPTIIEAEEEQ